MCDYRCPTCDGGFPASGDTDECPWCGETMDAKASTPSSQRDPLSSLPSDRFGLPEHGPRPRGFERGTRSSRPLFEDDGSNDLFDTVPPARRDRMERLSDRFADNGEEPDE